MNNFRYKHKLTNSSKINFSRLRLQSQLSHKKNVKKYTTLAKSTTVLQEIVSSIRILKNSLSFHSYLGIIKRSFKLKCFLLALFLLLITIGLERNIANIVVLSVVPAMIMYSFCKLPFKRVLWVYKVISLAHCIIFLSIFWALLIILLPSIFLSFYLLFFISIGFCIDLDILPHYQLAMDPDPQTHLPTGGEGSSGNNNQQNPDPSPGSDSTVVLPDEDKDKDKGKDKNIKFVRKNWKYQPNADRRAEPSVWEHQLEEEGFVCAPETLSREEASNNIFWKNAYKLKNKYEDYILKKLENFDTNSFDSKISEARADYMNFEKKHKDYLNGYEFHKNKGRDFRHYVREDFDRKWSDIVEDVKRMDKTFYDVNYSWTIHTSNQNDIDVLPEKMKAHKAAVHNYLKDEYAPYANFYWYKSKEKFFLLGQLEKKKDVWLNEKHKKKE